MNPSIRPIPVILVILQLGLLYGSLGSSFAVAQNADREYFQAPEILKRHDKNQDGKIAKDEAGGLLKRNFGRVDLNDDGFVDKSELEQLAKRLRESNPNRNRNRNRSRNRGLSAEQIRARAGNRLTVKLDVPYREGNDAWKLDLAMPKDKSDKPRPAIVFIHGGGWTNGDKRTAPFIGPTLQYAERGYVCVSVNYRLGGPIRHCIEDVKCAVRWLRAHAEEYGIDPNRIGAYGNSAGAHLAVMLALSSDEKKLEGDGPHAEYSSAIQAAAASATPTRPRARRNNDDAKLIAPMSYVRADAPPLLLFHDKSDRTVPIGNSDDLAKALQEAGAKDVSYKRYDNDSGHGVFQKNIKETGPLLAKFFARTLGGSAE